LRTALGYQYHEDRFQNGADYTFKQNQIYSEAAYQIQNFWEIYGRIGIADLTISDGFRPHTADAITSKADFNDNWSVYGTIGGKLFYPVDKGYGIGIFVQAGHALSDYSDSVSGTVSGVPFLTEVSVKNFWNVSVGMGLQITGDSGVKVYAGPYLYYAEAKISPSVITSATGLTSGETHLKNKSNLGGFMGIAFPLFRMFDLNIEGQYSERFSISTAVTFTY